MITVGTVMCVLKYVACSVGAEHSQKHEFSRLFSY